MNESFRRHFPILSRSLDSQPLIWLDSAATTQKPQAVIDAVSRYYEHDNANVHRSAHQLSCRATTLFEASRERVRQFINAAQSSQIIWTRGTTEGMNMLAASWGRENLQPGDEIVLSQMEHHANILPWQRVAKERGAILRVIPIDADGQLDQRAYRSMLNRQTRVVSLTHASNVLGTVNPIEAMVATARDAGALTVIDGAQAVAHMTVDVTAIDCDFYLFSSHKVYGPTGIGVLYGRQDLLEQLSPWQVGGEMVRRVSFSESSFASLPYRLEAGTPPVAAAIGLGAAIEFLQQYDSAQLQAHEASLGQYLDDQLDSMTGLRRVGRAVDKIAVSSFITDGLHHQDVGIVLDQHNIAVRTGHHCAMPLCDALKLPGTVRVSLGYYNSRDDVDALMAVLAESLSPAGSVIGPSASPPEQMQRRGTDDEATASAPSWLPHQPTYQPETYAEIDALFTRTESWQARYRTLVSLAARLPGLPSAMRTDQHRIPGCEAAIWIDHYYDSKDDRLHFALDCEARIMRGLITTLLSGVNGRPPQELLDCPVEQWFARWGFMRHLSPSRANALHTMVQQIKAVANRYL